MAKYPSHSLQRDLFFKTLRVIICFSFLRGCITTSYFNFDLSTVPLHPQRTGFVIDGNANNDQFGSSVSTAGDLNHDGYDDIIVGAPTKDDRQGAAYVIYGGPTSTFLNLNLASTTLNPATTGFMITDETTGGDFGESVSTAGDINKDGYDDVIVGSPFKRSAYIIYGGSKSSMSNLDLSASALNPTTTGFKITATGGWFGISVSTAGDIDGDGYDDFIIGAPTSKGAVYVIYGREKSSFSNLALNLNPLNPATTGFMITANAAGDGFGNSVSTAGDINKDGYGDIIVGAHQTNSYQGAAYVIYGGPRSSMSNIDLETTPLNPATTGFMITGENSGNYFGNSVSTAGDVNKDGFADIIIGERGAVNSNPGFAYVIYGGPKSSMSNIDLGTTPLDPASTGFKITGQGGWFGWSVSAAGDLNRDGYGDVMVGAYGKYTVSVVYGGPKSLMSDINLSMTTLDPATTGFQIKTSGGSFGYSVQTAGDFNQDGNTDIIIGSMSKATSRGGAYVIHAVCPLNCNKCTNPSTCAECATPHLLYDSKCFATCPSATFKSNDICSDCPSHCSSCTSLTSCQTCDQGYGLSTSSSLCESCSANCNKCTTPSSCTQCANSYFLHQAQCVQSCPGATYPSSGLCQACPSQCSSCTSQTSCQGCNQGYALSGSLCASCPSNCNQCTIPSSCTQCSNTYFLHQGQCVQSCPGATYPSAGSCLGCPSHCSSCTSQTSCQTCDQGYGLSGSLCASCPANCKQCATSSSCSQCADSYFLYQSQCVQSCPTGTFPSAGSCQSCPSQCSSCSALTSCQTCDQGYGLSSFTSLCESCPANCNQCTIASSCTQCSNTYFLHQGQCVQSCPIATFPSAGLCQDCPSHCSLCSSSTSCQICDQGYILSNSLCILPPPTIPPLQEEVKATQAVSSGAKGIGSAVCAGRVTFPQASLVSKIIQNTRYLNFSVTENLAEIYQTWDTDLISWDTPDRLSQYDHFGPSSYLFAQYGLNSPFLINFWSTIMIIGVTFTVFITCFLAQIFLAKPEDRVYSLLQKLIIGAFNFALVQIYGCLDDVVFYLVLDFKTNPLDDSFSWASLICAFSFLVVGCLLILFNFWTVRSYQRIKAQGLAKDLDDFNEKNKYWELFYSDFNDDNFWSQSFLAFLVMRNGLSSLTTVLLSDFPLMQTITLIIMDITIILYLISKKPFATLRGTLAQYYFETITLLVHICAFILSLYNDQNASSEKFRRVLCTAIIYLNNFLLAGSLGFMFIEIYKTISQMKKAGKIKQSKTIAIQTNPEEILDIQETNRKLNSERDATTDSFHLPTRFRHDNNISSRPLNSKNNADNSAQSDLNISDFITRDQSMTPIVIRARPRVVRQSKSVSVEQFEET